MRLNRLTGLLVGWFSVWSCAGCWWMTCLIVWAVIVSLLIVVLCMYQLASTLCGAHNVYYVKSGGPQVRPYVNNNKCYVRQVWPISAPLCCVTLSVCDLSAVCAASNLERFSIAIAVGYLQKIRIFLDTPISSACHF